MSSLLDNTEFCWSVGNQSDTSRPPPTFVSHSASFRQLDTMALITIVDDGDLVVEVIQSEKIFNDEGGSSIVEESAQFKVRRSVLTAKSNVFRTMLQPGYFEEGSKTKVQIQDVRVASMEIWFRTLHKSSNIYSVKLEEMCHLVAACDKYNLNITELRAWFATWYEKHNIDQYYDNWNAHSKKLEGADLTPRSLLFPCWRFNHATGFLRATRFLVYNCMGHITEQNPTKHYEFHLESRYIGKSSLVLSS